MVCFLHGAIKPINVAHLSPEPAFGLLEGYPLVTSILYHSDSYKVKPF